MDGNAESRGGTISTFNGIEPIIETFADREAVAVGEWLADYIAEGCCPTNRAQQWRVKRTRSALKAAVAAAVELTDKIETTGGGISIGTTHRAKRSEFRAVAVMACDDDAIRQPRSR